MNQQRLEEKITQYPICEYAFINPKQISFLDRVRYICETECPQYGRSWSCPPAVGTVEECKERCSCFTGGFLFTTIAEVCDIADMKETLKTRVEHEEITRAVEGLFLEECKKVQVLSTESCAICEECAYPKEPCRHLERMFPCIESYGILVTELAEQQGISFFNGSNVVTWFSLILYQE